MRRSPSRKRPCRICKRWFLPDPRLKDRQKTCGELHCQRKWHRRKCAEWNKRNSDYFKANYLQKKLEKAGSEKASPRSRLKSGLPLSYVQEVVGVKQLVIMDYIVQLLIVRSPCLSLKYPYITRANCQLPGQVFSRGDPHLTC